MDYNQYLPKIQLTNNKKMKLLIFGEQNNKIKKENIKQ